MKNLLVIFCIFFSLQATSQSFEGTVTWTINPGSTPPTTVLLKAKGGTVITVLQGGIMNGLEMWSSDNNKKVVRVIRARKMYVTVPPEALQGVDKSVTYGKFVKTAETKTIVGYACTQYTGEVTEQGKTVKMSILDNQRDQG